MVGRRCRFTTGASLLSLAALIVACSSSARVDEADVPAALRELAAAGELRVRSYPIAELPDDLGSTSCIAITADGWRVPALDLDEGTSARLAAFVGRGGRLVLLGYAAALAVDLGFEEERPEAEPFRWGYDARAVDGRARLGVRVVSGRLPELFEGLTAAADQEFVHHLTGGAPCCVPLCAWTVGRPQRGAVLAALATEVDGYHVPSGPPVMVRWRYGRGDVVALGVAPALDHADDEVRGNARRLVRNLLAGAGRTDRPASRDVALLRLPAPTVGPPAGSTPVDFAESEIPMAPLLAHWGWRAELGAAGEPDVARSVAELVAEVLAPSWAAGADLLELAICDPDRGSPLSWSDHDALARPDGYRGGAWGGSFGAAAFGAVADEAHGRGMLLHAFLDPPPPGERTRERLASLRFFARELADVRRLGTRAVDGLGLRRWFHDESGFSLAMLQDLHPAGLLYRTGELAPHVAGSLRALDAEDGALRGVAAAGLSARWRDGFPADLFPLGVLDARVDRALPSRAGPTYGGGSYGDWIVLQANDFVRPRAGAGAALWWRAHDVETLGLLGADYVHGISLDPLRAAVAVQLAATGRNGYRAAAARLVADAPPGFGAEAPVAAAVHVLQNNWFRLAGSGGGLLFDPRGLARFRPGEAIVVSPRFLSTRLFGGRPHADTIRGVELDFLRAGSATEGGHGRTAIVDAAARRGHGVPAILAFDDQPRWPQRVSLGVTLEPGYYELEIQARAVRHRGLLVASLDGTVLDCRPFGSGAASPPATVAVHVAEGGLRRIGLAVAEGGAVALDRLRLVRRGDVAAEGEVRIPAGHVAEVGERSASSYHADRIDLRTIGDFPGFVIRIDCERAARNLRVERALHLPAYGELAAADEGAARLRRPFVLRADSRAMPDLVVVPLQLPRYAHFRHEAGTLTLKSSPEAGSEVRVGFWLAPHGTGPGLREHATVVLRAIDQPLQLELGDRGHGTLIGDLPRAWTRVVQVRSASATPYLVRENGWWTWRGGQPAGGGGDWLRVCQLPGDVVEVVGGPAVLARTRPGPGALRVVALRDVGALRARARVMQPCRLAPPSVVMAADFDEVRLDGEPWAFFDGRTVFLPDRPGDYTIVATKHGGPATPHVARTRAPLSRCEYDAERRVLVLVCAGDADRPVELPYTAVLAGGRPTAIENGEIVDEDALPHSNAETRARAEAGGVLIRFGAGVTKVHYEN